MVFDVELGQLGQRPNNLTLECWDKDPMTFSKDFLGSAEVDLDKHLFRKALRKWDEGETGTIVRYPVNDHTPPEEGSCGRRCQLKCCKRPQGGEPPVPRRWMTLHNKEGSDSCGEVQVTIELLPKSLAALCPAGKGRGEPNAHPTLPEPEGRVKLSALTPFSVLKGLFGLACGTVCCVVSCVVLVLILFVL